jgi:diguanylate cyclase (GGDEF)-like protein
MNLPNLFKILAVALLYFLSAEAVSPLSLVDNAGVFAIWPPTGVALSALFLFGYRMWPGIFFGALALDLTIFPLIPSLTIAITNTLGPVVGFWFLQRYNKQNIFESVRMMMLFILAIIIASIITASGGTLTLFIHNIVNMDTILQTWSSWFVGDLIGFLLIAPILEAYALKKNISKSLLSLEGALLITVLIVLNLIIFGPLAFFSLIEYPIAYVVVAPLIWASLGFRPIVAVVTLFLTTLFSIVGTILGYGPFLRSDLNQTLILLQIFNGVGAITILIMTTISHEIRRAYEQLSSSMEALEHKANYDDLTDIPNRFAFSNALSHAIEQAKRNKEKVALLFIDLDHFKEINDSLGHNIGDVVLTEATKRLKNMLRKSDTLARLGGDEFTVIIESIEDVQVIADISHKIVLNMREPIMHMNQPLYVTASIGISIYPDDGLDAKTLQRNADSAMYKAKAEGRDNYQYYTSSMTANAFDHIRYESSLRNALKTDELVVCYQPQINLEDSSSVSMEALVRWNHPELGIVSPIKFIPIAESTGLIVELGQIVLEQSVKQIVAWKKTFDFVHKVSVNLSTKQLEQADIAELIQVTLEKYQCKPEWLELEITEGYIIKDPQKAIVTLKAIQELGITIAIDDFGTGYSSLSYLKKLPINKLKIDKSFVDDCHIDKDDQVIIKTIIALSQQMNLSIIAEGVELPEQQAFLEAEGCIDIQGYIFSKPLPNDEFTLFLERWVV